MPDYVVEFIDDRPTLEVVDERPIIEVSSGGPQGATGAGIKVIGELTTVDELPATSEEPGDAYIINGGLWVYSVGGQWVDTGFVEGAASTVPGPPGPVGPKGEPGNDSTVPGPVGPAGERGYSSYEVAVLNGYVGSETEWLASLKGPKGDQGLPGKDSTVPGPAGPQGERGLPGADSTVPGPQGIPGVKGDPGDDAYEVAVANGFVGTRTQWLASLIGPKGDKGDKGDTGATGAASTVPGPKGDPGIGVPAGGTTGQALIKSSNADYATTWGTVATGGGSGAGWELVFNETTYNTTNWNLQSVAPGDILASGQFATNNPDGTIRIGTNQRDTFCRPFRRQHVPGQPIYSEAEFFIPSTFRTAFGLCFYGQPYNTTAIPNGKTNGGAAVRFQTDGTTANVDLQVERDGLAFVERLPVVGTYNNWFKLGVLYMPATGHMQVWVNNILQPGTVASAYGGQFPTTTTNQYAYKVWAGIILYQYEAPETGLFRNFKVAVPGRPVF